MLAQEFFGLEKRICTRFEPGSMSFNLDAALSSHEVDRVKSRLQPLFLICFGLGKENVAEALGMDPIPGDDPERSRFADSIGKTGLRQRHIFLRSQPDAFTLKLFP